MANAPVQRMSQLMAKTLRDDPADAEVLSHKLLVRAGYVRRTAAGIWSCRGSRTTPRAAGTSTARSCSG